MGVEIARLLLTASTALTLTACDADKGKPSAPQATAAVGAAAGVDRTNRGAAAAINSIDRSHAGTPAPATVFEVRGGGKTSIAELVAAGGGKRVLVNLWATWCAPCLAEMPDLDAMAAGKAQTLLVVPISQDMEGWKPVDGFFKAGRFRTLKPYLDQPGSFAEAVKARGLPMSILYDARGREVWRVAGTLQWGSAAVRAAL